MKKSLLFKGPRHSGKIKNLHRGQSGPWSKCPSPAEAQRSPVLPAGRADLRQPKPAGGAELHRAERLVLEVQAEHEHLPEQRHRRGPP